MNHNGLLLQLQSFGVAMVELSQQSVAEFPLSVKAEYTPFVNFAMIPDGFVRRKYEKSRSSNQILARL